MTRRLPTASSAALARYTPPRAVERARRYLADPDPREALPVDVEPRGDEYVLTADLPGVTSQHVHVTIEGHRVRIDVDPTEASREREFTRRERARHGAGRTVELPGPVDKHSATARLQDGVLEVRVRRRW